MMKKDFLDVPLELDYEVVHVERGRYGTGHVDRPEQFTHTIAESKSGLVDSFSSASLLDVCLDNTITTCDHGWNMRFTHGKKTISIATCHDDKKVFVIA